MQPADQFEMLAAKCAAHIASFGDEFASAPELRGIDLAALTLTLTVTPTPTLTLTLTP